MMGLRFCYVSPEYFGLGVHGGFGYVTKTLSEELAHRGFDVYVVTPRRNGQAPVETVNGVKVLSYKPSTGLPWPAGTLASRRGYIDLVREIDADIYHSQAVSLNTYVAQKATPDKRHLVTFQDPYDEREWARIAEVEPRYRGPRHRARVRLEKHVLSSACRRADALYTQARFLAEKARAYYGFEETPRLLPNPVPIPENPGRKSPRPTVCFLARWDPQKRVELFLKLAPEHPEVQFIAMGHSHDDAKDMELRERYGGAPNLQLTGFVSEMEKSRILGTSWALVNTSIREALPVSFLEALAHGTPIISGENPDGLTSDYGYVAEDGDYSAALNRLLTDDERQDKGRRGRRHVMEAHEAGKVVDRHVEIYESSEVQA
jgi:glycosyltransferase involved in cell wall biosynthesis